MKGGKVANAASTWGGAFWQGHQRITARQQIQARRALCAAPVLPYSGCRGEGKGRLKSLAPAHQHMGDDVVDQMRRGLGHAPRAA